MKKIFEKWLSKGNKVISLINYKDSWSKNGVGRVWGARTNGAKKENPKDTCFDMSIRLGYLVFNYTNFNF